MLQSDTSLFQHKKAMVPLVAPNKPKRPSFVGEAYSEITDAGYYKISDIIGRNYSMTSRGLTLRAIDAVLHKGKRIQDALEKGIPAQKKAKLIATGNKRRPFNLPPPEPVATYESISMKRKISHKSLRLGNASSKELLGTSAAIETSSVGKNTALSPSKMAMERTRISGGFVNTKVLLTPAPTPRLFKDDHELPTTDVWRPQPRYLENMKISAAMPSRLPKKKRTLQIIESSKRYQAMVDSRVEHAFKMQTQLQKVADSNAQKQWIDNAILMLPQGGSKSSLKGIIENLKSYAVANAKSAVSYDLMDPFIAQQEQIDVTALHPPPEHWYDRSYQSEAWKILRNTGVPNYAVVAAYTFMENESFVATQMMLQSQKLWENFATELGFKSGRSSFTEIDSAKFRATLPLSPSNFESKIRHFSVQIREQLISNWLKQCQDILLAAFQTPPAEEAEKVLWMECTVEKEIGSRGEKGSAPNNAVHTSKSNKNSSSVLDGITSLKKRYEALDEPEQPHDKSLGMKTEMDEVEEWLSNLPTLDEGVAKKVAEKAEKPTLFRGLFNRQNLLCKNPNTTTIETMK